MELNHYPDTDGDRNSYNVNFSIQSHEYYYFLLDSRNGELIHAMNSIADDLDREPLAVSVLEDKKDALYRMAEDYLVSRLGKEKDYERVVYSYRDKDGLLDNFNHIFFYFIKADGSARKYLVCPKAYRAEIKGTGTKLDVVKNAMLRRIPDMHAETDGGTKAHWRTLNMATVFAVEAEGATFNVVR